MANIYTLDLHSLELLNFERTPTDEEYTLGVGAVIYTSNRKFNEFFESFKTEYNFSDVFILPDNEYLYTSIHYHNDKEARIILKGQGTFYIPSSEMLVIIDVSAGDVVTLDDNVIHWFSAKNELVSLRYFSENVEYASHKPEINDDIKKAYHLFKKGFIVNPKQITNSVA